MAKINQGKAFHFEAFIQSISQQMNSIVVFLPSGGRNFAKNLSESLFIDRKQVSNTRQCKIGGERAT